MTTFLSPEAQKARSLGNLARAAIVSVLAVPHWRIREESLAAAFESVHTETLDFWFDDEPELPQYTLTADGVAIVPVVGKLVDEEPDWWHAWMGYASTPHIGRMITEARDDSNARAIALYFDSPGGQVYGIATLQDIIFS